MNLDDKTDPYPPRVLSYLDLEMNYASSEDEEERARILERMEDLFYSMKPEERLMVHRNG